MIDRDDCFTPFDRMYAEVSRMTREYLNKLNDPLEHFWLANTIWRFQLECDAWQHKEELEPYVLKMKNFNLKMLHLTSGAYLHIAYDLPRVMADMTSECANNTSVNASNFENRLADIFDDLETIFPTAISLMSRRADIFGYTGVLLASLPLSKKIIETWIGNLRKRAWSHARQLLRMSHADRLDREEALLVAVTAALEDTLKYKPWKVLEINPPTLPFPKYAPAYTGAIFLPFLNMDVEPYLSLLVNFFIFIAVGFVALETRDFKKNQSDFQDQQTKRAIENENTIQDTLVKNLKSEYVPEVSRKEVDEYDLITSQLLEHFSIRVDKYIAVAFESPGAFENFRSNFKY